MHSVAVAELLIDCICCKNGRALERESDDKVSVVMPYSGKTIMSTPYDAFNCMHNKVNVSLIS